MKTQTCGGCCLMPYTATHRSSGPIVLVRPFQMSPLAFFSIVEYGKLGRSDVGISNSLLIKFNSLFMYRIPLSLLPFLASLVSPILFPFLLLPLLSFPLLCPCLSCSVSALSVVVYLARSPAPSLPFFPLSPVYICIVFCNISNGTS